MQFVSTSHAIIEFARCETFYKLPQFPTTTLVITFLFSCTPVFPQVIVRINWKILHPKDKQTYLDRLWWFSLLISTKQRICWLDIDRFGGGSKQVLQPQRKKIGKRKDERNLQFVGVFFLNYIWPFMARFGGQRTCCLLAFSRIHPWGAGVWSKMRRDRSRFPDYFSRTDDWRNVMTSGHVQCTVFFFFGGSVLVTLVSFS